MQNVKCKIKNYKNIICNLQFVICSYQKGITSLVEIMIIVTVLSILAAASIVYYQGAKQRIQIRKSCAALNNIRAAFQNYWSERDYYPLTSTITSFDTLYNQLSAVGLDTNPEKEFKGFISYTRVDEDTYTLVVRACGMKGVLLTATPQNIEAVDGTKDYSDLCRQ